nr:MAG TPA: hypothetical protein [Caudoviricetes sp.]
MKHGCNPASWRATSLKELSLPLHYAVASISSKGTGVG